MSRFIYFFIFLLFPLLEGAPRVTVIGKVKRADGLGRQTLELLELYKDHFTVNCIPTRKPDFTGISDDLRMLINYPGPIHTGDVVFYEEFLWFPGGESYHKIVARSKRNNQIRIAQTMFDATEIPERFTQIINAHFDAVAVPDKFYKEVYQKAGVAVPIFVLPLCFNFKDLLEEPIKVQRHTPFVFSFLGSCVVRKNVLTLLRAFAQAFPNDEDVLLQINSRYCDRNYLSELYKELKILRRPNISLRVKRLDQASYKEALLGTDCLVNISKGEGFSIQPREAMALGIPVIVTNNTAQTTLCESGLVVAVPSLIKEPAYSTILKQIMGEDFNCEVADVAKALREVYDNYDFYLSTAQKRRAFAAQYDTSCLLGRYLNLVNPKTLQLGEVDEVTDEGLTTTSKELYEKYQRMAE
jgi:glycosyltransferase involved in cell wall biosynthesis